MHTAYLQPLICSAASAKRLQIFAINTVVPMLAAVYWEGAIPSQFQLGLNVATLCGSMLGQVTFGVLADIYGRRKMYGLELIVTIVGSLGFAMSSPGVNNSMSMIGWLVFFRLLTGVGIGADYPLSAVITAECVLLIHDCHLVAKAEHRLGQVCADEISSSHGRGGVLLPAGGPAAGDSVCTCSDRRL